MTHRRDFKRRVRVRQAHTGESYMAARRAVLENREPVSVIETLDLGDLAHELGLRCNISMFPDVAERVEPRAALERLRHVLHATIDDPKLQLFRQVALAGERPRRMLRWYDDLEETMQFLRRVRAGIGGVNDGGSMLGIHVGAEPVLCTITLATLIVDRTPRIVMTSAPEEIDSLVRRLMF